MATVEEITDPYMQAFTPPPPAGAGVCDICHNAPFAGQTRCWSCQQTTGGVTHPVEHVVPISHYKLGQQLHTILKDYKRSQSATVRAQFLLVVAATLSRFLRDHGGHVAAAGGDQWDVITIVPSKRASGAPHALELAIQRSARLSRSYQSLLEPWQPDFSAEAKRASSDRTYRARVAIDRGTRVLLIDDTFTTGATVQSAATALTLAGATVVGAVVVGRVIHPDFTDEMGAMWSTQRKTKFDFAKCCLE